MVNLTRKWKDGKLETGLYYVKYKDGKRGKAILIRTPKFYGFYCYYSLNNKIAKVLDRVPDYDDWVYLYKARNDAADARDTLAKREKMFRLLLNKCYIAFNRNLIKGKELSIKETVFLLNEIADISK